MTSLPPKISPVEPRSLSLLFLREDIGDSYEAIVQTAAEAVEAQACHLALYDAETMEMISRRPRYSAPGDRIPHYGFPLESSPASALVVRTASPYIRNDPAIDSLYDSSVAARRSSARWTCRANSAMPSPKTKSSSCKRWPTRLPFP